MKLSRKIKSKIAKPSLSKLELKMERLTKPPP
jgi:hypothetical protein